MISRMDLFFFGGLLTNLLFRTLPDYYPTGSVYAHFPFLEPSYMKDNLERRILISPPSTFGLDLDLDLTLRLF